MLLLPLYPTHPSQISALWNNVVCGNRARVHTCIRLIGSARRSTCFLDFRLSSAFRPMGSWRVSCWILASLDHANFGLFLYFCLVFGFFWPLLLCVSDRPLWLVLRMAFFPVLKARELLTMAGVRPKPVLCAGLGLGSGLFSRAVNIEKNWLCRGSEFSKEGGEGEGEERGVVSWGALMVRFGPNFRGQH